MDRVITDMTQQVQELQRVQSQTEILRHHLQEEKQQLERELQSSQELLQKLQEEHKSNPPDFCRTNPALGDDNVKLQSEGHTQLHGQPGQHDAGNADSLTMEITEMADAVRAEVSEDNEQLKTMEHSPYNPNLVCPMCGKRHRVGEIQKFRAHVKTCNA